MTTTVGLVQVSWGLTWSHSEHDGGEATSYSLLPYSVGLLQAYAASRLPSSSIRWLPAVHDRVPPSEAADRLEGADVVAASTYVWNVAHTLAIASEVKRRSPGTLVVLGGPQVPDRAEEFLRRHRQVDLVCHGEGEVAFASLLERAGDSDFTGIAGLSYLDDDGRFVTEPRAGRTEELDAIPSPYLSGAFDELMARHPDERWVATWETNRGCPFSCTFCDWGSATAARVYRFGMDRLQGEIDWFAEHRVGFVLCCDANFGMLPRDVDIARRVVDAKRRTGFPFSLSVQNAKNATERCYEIQKLLNDEMHTIGVTLSLQSADPGTLRNIRRTNIRSSSFTELQRRFVRDGLYTYTDLILGLPGETYGTFADGVSHVIAGGQHNHVQFHNCSVLPNAEMADPDYMRRFGTVTVPQPIRSVYAPASEVPEVEEHLETVVGTGAMPGPDWVRAKSFAWMTDLVYFDRLLHVPMLILGRRHGVAHRRLVEALTEVDAGAFPVLGWVRQVLRDQARRIQDGGVEYLAGDAWGGLLWPADQHVYITMVLDGTLDAFYEEAGRAFSAVLDEARIVPASPDGQVVPADAAGGTGLRFDPEEETTVLEEALALNRAALRLPGRSGDERLVCSHDVWGYWLATQAGTAHPLTEEVVAYRIRHSDRQWQEVASWAEYLTWCHGRDKRGYLAAVEPLRRAVAAAR